MKFQKGFILLATVFFLGNFIAPAQAQSSQETLQQYVADLQKSPSDTALREKIIKLTLTMTPAPATPKDVIRHEGAAEFAFKNAKTAADFADAAKEYEEALLLAPWLAQDYFNCGVAYEKAEKFAEAVRNFNFYLLAAPDAKDANDVLKRIGGLEYAANKVSKESSPEVVAEKKQNSEAEFMKSLDRAKYTGQSRTFDGGIVWDNELTIIGTTLTWKQRKTYVRPGVIVEIPVGTWYEEAAMPIIGRKAEVHPPEMPSLITATFIISDDGNSITRTNGGNENFTFYRQ